MNIYKFVNCWEDKIADLILKAINSKDELKEVDLYRIFEFIWNNTNKINFLNKEKLFNCFYKSLSLCKIPEEKRVVNFYRYICKNLCGIKKDFYKIKIRVLIQDLIGFERTGDICEL